MCRFAATLLALLLGTSSFAGTSTTPPSTTNNDDSCDVALQPAATLLLPYFEVDFNAPRASAVQTIFTVQNVSAHPQIANVTLWTDWGYPAFSFPLFLTGYDVQPVNLYDILALGALPSTSSAATVPQNPTNGSTPLDNAANPNFLPGVAAACAATPSSVDAAVLRDLRLAFTTGAIGCPSHVGGVHSDAIGYATIDVVATCAAKNPASSDYVTSLLLFDNVLTGDYQLLWPRDTKSYAQGGTLVHIRAIPEGGPAGAVTATDLPYTFYDRYTRALPSRTADRRQPLPAVFVPRLIQGGTGGFNTLLKIWREGVVGDAACADYIRNDRLRYDIVRFDEHENATLLVRLLETPTTTLTFAVVGFSSFFPAPPASGDVGGWVYLNLNNGQMGGRPSQNWVIGSMFAEPTYAVELPSIALGNGCSPAVASGAKIGPLP